MSNLVDYAKGELKRNKEDWLPQYEGKWVSESEDVLDKIRAEIEEIAFDWQEIDGEHESFMVVDLNDALQIIDKYKAESEEV